ncbi:MAG: hypothetical protein AAGB11_08430 [Pseudomonadota bacterium]
MAPKDLAGAAPVEHYVLRGWKEGRNPHALFDTNWYLATNADIRSAGIDPLRHYMDFGWREGRAPHILFDPKKYERDYRIGAASNQNPLLHYVQEGWQCGFDPHVLFSTTWYLCHNADAAITGREPLGHYLAEGWKRGARPNPAFDPHWYLEQNRDVERTQTEPLTHYLMSGWREGLVPIRELQDALEDKKYFASEGVVTPLERYVTDAAFRQNSEPKLFNAAFYRATDPALAALDDRELHRHFVTEGFAEGRVGNTIRHRCVAAHPVTAPRRAPKRRPVEGSGRPQYSAPLIIAGFHRSGTSMTANLFADAGIYLGDDLLGAKPSNPYGHFEDKSILSFHENILRRNGQNWQTATDMPPVLTRADWRFMLDYGVGKSEHAAWGFKDPRVCYFLPQWRATFPDMAVVYVYRPCIDCVHSMRKRAARDFSVGHAVDLNFEFFRDSDVAIRMYLNYAQQALRFLENDRGRKLVIPMADLLQNRDIVSEVRKTWDYQLADVMPFDVYDGMSLSQSGPNEPILDESLLAEIQAVEERFNAILN